MTQTIVPAASAPVALLASLTYSRPPTWPAGSPAASPSPVSPDRMAERRLTFVPAGNELGGEGAPLMTIGTVPFAGTLLPSSGMSAEPNVGPRTVTSPAPGLNVRKRPVTPYSWLVARVVIAAPAVSSPV